MFANPPAEIGCLAEAALFRDGGDLIGSVPQKGLGFLQADVGEVFDDGHAGLSVEESAEGAAMIAEFRGDAFGGEIGVGEFLFDDVACALDKRRDARRADGVGDVVEHL